MKQIVYIVTSDSHSIEVWKLLETGKMSLIQIVNTDNGSGQPLTIAKKRNKLYVGIKPKCSILVYDILENGKLKKIGERIIPYSLNYLSCDHEEKFLFCSYYHDNCISVHALHTDHIPNPPMQIINNVQGCHSINIDLSNQLVFSPALLEDRIYLYTLTYLKKNIFPLHSLKYMSCSTHSGPRHMTFHNNKKYAYSINEINGTIDVWKINNTQKSVQHIQNIQSSIPKHASCTKYWAADIHVTSCGTYLYASDRFHHTITGFKIHEKNNTLMMIDQYDTSKQPRSFDIDKTNKFLIVAGQSSNTIMVHAISHINGSLHILQEYSVGKNPIWVLIHTI